jgi:hypothetical protein
MTGSTEGGAPEIRRVDESATVPSEKAHKPPLQPAPAADKVRVHVGINSDGVSVDGKAEVGRGIHDAVNYAVVCGAALATATVAVGLCLMAGANGWGTFLVAAAASAVVLALGLIRTSTKRRSEPPKLT